MPPRHRITAPPHHRITVSVSHLPCPLPPNQSVICFAPCHQASQSFALPPPTTSLHHCITASPRHHISQSFALPPATKPVSHLPCITATASPRHCVSQSFVLPPTTVSLHHHVIMSPCHHVTASPHHRITVLVSHLPCPLPPNQSVICLAHCHQTSQSFALPPTTASSRPRVTAPPRHCITASLC